MQITPSSPFRSLKRLILALPILAFLGMSSLPDFALAKTKSPKADAKNESAEEDSSLLKASTFAGLKLRSLGPAMMSGRIADIAVHPHDQSTWYVGVGSGGVWKTENAGTTWTSIFDSQPSYSIGCVTIDKNQPEVIWVGTGENVGGRHVGFGDGIYRSADGGMTWEKKGLGDSEHIGNIVIDPRDSNVVYVAVQGPLWSAGGDRGLFKTTDGGDTWEKILGKAKKDTAKEGKAEEGKAKKGKAKKNEDKGDTEAKDTEAKDAEDYVGVNEVAMDPRNPDVLYASTHQRVRTVAALLNGGPGSGIHKSVDGGKTWRQLRNGLPGADKGKIGLAISPQNPDVVYATIELAFKKGGFFRSANGGESWEKRSDYVSGGTGPHYYQEIFASPHKFDRIYQMDPRMHVSEDGGKTFVQVGEAQKHGDNHALAFNPDDPDYLLNGSDGGVYESWDLGKTWKFISNLPLTQFYKLAVDYDEPFYNIYGGTQDNSTQGGPSRTDNISGIRTSDWFLTLFADGHQPAVDPTNPDIIYSEWQEGNLVRHDRKTGEIVYIQPQPGKGEGAERWNWDSPILISPHDPARLYFASQHLWRSDNRGDSWKRVSGDLSRGQERLKMPMMGRVWSYDAIWDVSAMSNFGNVTSVSESPVTEGLIYVGTDDGLIQVTEDGGENWRKIEVKALGVPEASFVNDIKADLHDDTVVYVMLDNHKNGDFRPMIYRSADRGQSWTSIAGDPEDGGLPERHLVWRLVQDHVNKDLLFVGTEFGVFFSVSGGNNWIKITGGAPNIPFRDLAIQKRENDLVGATFGRGFYVFDDYTPLRTISEEVLEQEAELFAVKDAWWYIPKRPLSGPKGSFGADFFTAPNPPFGAIFTYYLKEGAKTLKQKRQEEEKKIAEDGGDTPFPGWDAIRQEDEEEAPSVILTVRDADGNVVRRITGPAGSGFHRIAWDLRYASSRAWSPARAGGFGPFGGGGGPLVAPGTYSVSLAQRVSGELKDFGKSQTFKVVPLRKGTLQGMDHGDMVDMLREVDDLQRRLSGDLAAAREASTRVEAIRDTLLRALDADESLGQEARRIHQGLLDLRVTFVGLEQADEMGEPMPPSIQGRLGTVGIGNAFSTYGPTEMHRQVYEIAKEEYAEANQTLRQLVDDLEALETKLDAAGVPWTPGRGVSGSE